MSLINRTTRRKSPHVIDLKRPRRNRLPALSWPKLSPKWWLLAAGVVVVVGLGVVALRHRAPDAATAQHAAVVKVGQLMLLPSGEQPTYGTVTDASKLNKETFFKQARDGDEVLIYERAKLSILYRPSINKLVNVGPLVVGTAATPYVTSRLAVIDGSGVPGAAQAMVQRIKTALPNATIAVSKPASRTYPQSLVIDRTKQQATVAEQVADSLGIATGQAPLGEGLPDVDLVIIVGADRPKATP